MSVFEGWDPPRPGWVCRECAFDFDATDPTRAHDALADAPRRYRVPLTRGLRDEDLDALLRTRPSPERWSALEYACHVRDALGLYDQRVGDVLGRDDPPDWPAMRREEIVTELRYNEQDPAQVADEVEAAATGLAARLASVPDNSWERYGTREGEQLSVAWMTRNALHEVNHHLLDIGRTLREVRGRS